MAQSDTPTNDLRGRAESMVTDMQKTGREAATAFQDVADTFGDAIDESLKRRPYATLAVVFGFGFLFGAAWSR
jgi:ElaB/YqjD/DUF883 family membrane-anchored ribosome-binding protein